MNAIWIHLTPDRGFRNDLQASVNDRGAVAGMGGFLTGRVLISFTRQLPFHRDSYMSYNRKIASSV